MKSLRLGLILPVVMSAAFSIDGVHAFSALENSHVFAKQPASEPASEPAATQADGSHDFDFLIGDWKAHVRRLPERLKGSNVWVEYNGISTHKKLLDSNANFEEFDVSSPDKKLRIKAQTLRLYNPESHQWSIYRVDLDKVYSRSSARRGPVFRKARRILQPADLGRSRGPGALCLAQHFTGIIANGTVFFGGRRKDMGSELDL